jgi:hypothetical protein
MEMDVYYIVDAEKHSIDRVEMARSGVISVRAGVSLLREEQLGQLAAVFSTTLESVTETLQNPPEPYVYTNSSVEESEMVADYNIAPEHE